jgi:hypothetical protein
LLPFFLDESEELHSSSSPTNTQINNDIEEIIAINNTYVNPRSKSKSTHLHSSSLPIEELTAINNTFINSRSKSKSTHLHSSSSSPTSAQINNDMEEITSINKTYPNSRSKSKSTHLHSSSSTSAQATVPATYIQTRSKSKQLISTTISPSTSNTCMAVEEITPNNHNNHATKKNKTSSSLFKPSSQSLVK